MSLKNTKVVILAGGKGTRFRPFSFVIPKPLMPIGEQPILWHLINRFKQNGITNFLISTGYQAELVRAYFGDGKKMDVSIKYFHEEKALGTAGPLSLMREEFKDDEYLFLINGDIYTEVNFQEMANFAEKSNSDVVVGVVEKVEKNSFGVLDVQDNKIKAITEKPERKYTISAGIYMIKGSALKNIPHMEFFTMPDLMNLYIKANKPIAAYRLDKFWIGIENAESLDEALKRIENI
jgi:NDP-sugar pyrophosphorylase family protein